MKILVTGVAGQLGHDVVNEIIKRGDIAIGSDIAPVYSGIDDGSAVTTADYISLDITDRDAVFAAVEKTSPDAIIHCAAWTAVDDAEDEDKKDIVFAVNHKGTKNLAEAAKAIDAKMLYISTDYVFNGEGTAPWEEDSVDFAPQNVYGLSKLMGENAVRETLSKYFIVRIAWVFGKNGKNFIKTMLNVGKKYDTVKVVSDQIGTPTYTLDLSSLLCDMIKSEKYGCYHATNEGGYISWYDFTKEIFKTAGYSTNVVPVTTAEYGLSKAKRPYNSRLSKDKLKKNGFTPLPSWKDALKRYLEEIEF